MKGSFTEIALLYPNTMEKTMASPLSARRSGTPRLLPSLGRNEASPDLLLGWEQQRPSVELGLSSLPDGPPTPYGVSGYHWESLHFHPHLSGISFLTSMVLMEPTIMRSPPPMPICQKLDVILYITSINYSYVEFHIIVSLQSIFNNH